MGTDPQMEPGTLERLSELERAATPIGGFPGYSINVDGQVFSRLHWRGSTIRLVTPIPNADGYPSVRLTRFDQYGTVRANRAVHRLVAATFLPPRPSPAHEVRHLNGDKSDPRLANLAWGTRQDNADDRARHGRTARGEANGAARLSVGQADEIKRAVGITDQRLAKTYGVSPRTVGRIRRGEQWT